VSGKDGKRRLPLVQAPADGGDGDPERAPWQWVAFGAVAIVTTWVPLTALAGTIVARLGPPASDAGVVRLGAAIATAYGCALALGSFVGGFVVGRWGGNGVGVREAGLAGLAAAAVAIAAATVTSGFSTGALLVVLVVGPSAAVGGALGLRARTRGS
jgi:hypothetical protein